MGEVYVGWWCWGIGIFRKGGKRRMGRYDRRATIPGRRMFADWGYISPDETMWRSGMSALRYQGSGTPLPPTIQLPRPQHGAVSKDLILRHVIRVFGYRGSFRENYPTVA